MKSVQPVTMLVALAFALMPGADSVSAQGPNGPKVKTQVASTGAKAAKAVGAPKAGGSSRTSGSPKSSAPKSDGAKLASGSQSDKSSKGGPKASATTSTSVATATESGATTDSGTTTVTDATGGNTPAAPQPNAISSRISRNPAQKARIEAMLPQGTTLEAASAGFRNQGQFIAAVNASKSQGVSFDALKTAMTVGGLSLGQAVKQVQGAPPATGTTSGTGTTTGAGTTTGTGTTTGAVTAATTTGA